MHSFCKQCLVAVRQHPGFSLFGTRAGTTMKCPICRKITKVGEERPNFVLKSVADAVLRQGSQRHLHQTTMGAAASSTPSAAIGTKRTLPRRRDRSSFAMKKRRKRVGGRRG